MGIAVKEVILTNQYQGSIFGNFTKRWEDEAGQTTDLVICMLLIIGSDRVHQDIPLRKRHSMTGNPLS